MATTIYYYTGTGNSLWTARLLAEELGDCALVPMARKGAEREGAGADAIGLVFPVHMWGVPKLALEFVRRLAVDPAAYYFAAAVNAGQVSRTLIQLLNLLKKRGIVLAAGFDVVLPSNYIPWGGPGPAAALEVKFRAARAKVKDAAAIVKERRVGRVDRGPLWQRIIFTALYQMSYRNVPNMDRSFWVDEKCNSCGICAKVCPVANVEMKDEWPTWLHRCEQCLACIQWCPQEAIQFGKKTPAYERYHHPEVRLLDIMPG